MKMKLEQNKLYFDILENMYKFGANLLNGHFI